MYQQCADWLFQLCPRRITQRTCRADHLQGLAVTSPKAADVRSGLQKHDVPGLVPFTVPPVSFEALSPRLLDVSYDASPCGTVRRRGSPPWDACMRVCPFFFRIFFLRLR